MWTRRHLISKVALGGLGLRVVQPSLAGRGGSSDAEALPIKLQKVTEPIIEPALPIIDSHHHLWLLSESFFRPLPEAEGVQYRRQVLALRGYARYLFEDFLSDVMTGHNIRATVYMEADLMRPGYKRKGPEAMQSLGEVEFANGVAAMAASGSFGDVQICAGIVGHVDLALGEAAVEEILVAHIQAAGGRYRGVRRSTPSSEVPHVLGDERFRSGFKCLHKLGLSFDALIFAPELPELIEVARAFPETLINLNHLGSPEGAERFAIWRDNIRALARCSNVTVKWGGLGMSAGSKSFMATPPLSSEQLAAQWKPYIETCIEAFGADRCMFESNFPMDSASCSYPVLWNAFKRLVTGASIHEKAALFSGTAARVYRLEV